MKMERLDYVVSKGWLKHLVGNPSALDCLNEHLQTKGIRNMGWFAMKDTNTEIIFKCATHDYRPSEAYIKNLINDGFVLSPNIQVCKSLNELTKQFCSDHDVDGITTATEIVREAGGKLYTGKVIVMPTDLNLFGETLLRDACDFLHRLHDYRITQTQI